MGGTTPSCYRRDVYAGSRRPAIAYPREYRIRIDGAKLDVSEFADALFGFLAVRERYLVSEVNVYRRALTSYEGVGTAIERNLAGLLKEARGVPERVPWILKVIGIAALGESGGPSARLNA